jgi:hypothetical protein
VHALQRSGIAPEPRLVVPRRGRDISFLDLVRLPRGVALEEGEEGAIGQEGTALKGLQVEGDGGAVGVDGVDEEAAELVGGLLKDLGGADKPG